MDYKRLLAANIRKERRRQDLTQEALAQKAGISAGYLSKVELAKCWPTLKVISKISTALEINPAELLDQADLEALFYIYTELEADTDDDSA